MNYTDSQIRLLWPLEYPNLLILASYFQFGPHSVHTYVRMQLCTSAPTTPEYTRKRAHTHVHVHLTIRHDDDDTVGCLSTLFAPALRVIIRLIGIRIVVTSRSLARLFI